MPLDPGFHFKEIDKSYPDGQARTQTGLTLVFGFTAKGRVAQYEVVTTLAEHEAFFGKPSNELESLTYLTVKNILAAGGTPLVCRIPYKPKPNKYCLYRRRILWDCDTDQFEILDTSAIDCLELTQKSYPLNTWMKIAEPCEYEAYAFLMDSTCNNSSDCTTSSSSTERSMSRTFFQKPNQFNVSKTPIKRKLLKKPQRKIKSICHILAPALIPEKKELWTRELLSIEAILRHKPANVRVILVCDSPETHRFGGICDIVTPKKTSRDIGDKRGLVLLSEVLSTARSYGDDAIFYTNSDCVIGPKTYERILSQEAPVVQYHRLDVQDNPKTLDEVYSNPNEVSVLGIDGLSLTKEFYDETLTKVKLDFYLGEPHWDTSIGGWLRNIGQDVLNSRDLYHPDHPSTWDCNNLSVAGKHNDELYREYIDYIGLKDRVLSFEKPEMSVIVVQYGDNADRIKNLEENLDRLELQDLEVEWILVEASNKESQLSEYSRRRNFKHIFLKTDSGNEVIWQKEAMLNIGAKTSSGKYVLFLDGDVYSESVGWFRRIQEKMTQSSQNVFLQPFSICYDTKYIDQSFMSQCAQECGYACDLPHNPGLVVCVSRDVLEVNGWLNPYAIFGSGDSCFLHEYSNTNRENYIFEKFSSMKCILREMKVKCDPAYLEEVVFHRNHGRVNRDYYIHRHEVIEKFEKKLNELVTLDSNGLMRWVDEGCNEKRWIKEMYSQKNAEWFDSERIFKV